MRTALGAMLVAAAVAGGVVPARGQVFSIGGGPARDVASDAPFARGFNVQAGAEFGLPLLPVAIRVEGMLNRFGSELDEGHFQVLAGTVNAVLELPALGLVPYLVGGVGVYRVPQPPGVDARRSIRGVNAGAGVRLGLGGRGLFLETRLHSTTDFETVFAPVVIGIRF